MNEYYLQIMNPINVEISRLRKRFNRKVKNHAKRIQQLKAKQTNFKERQQTIGIEEQTKNGFDDSQHENCKEKTSHPTEGHIYRKRHRESESEGKRHNRNAEKVKLTNIKKRTDRRYRILENTLQDLHCTEYSHNDDHKRTTSPDIEARPFPLDVLCNIQINGSVDMPTSSETVSKVRLKTDI